MRFHVRFTIVLKIHAFNFENWLPSTMVLNINCNRNNERNCQKKRRYLWHYWTQLKFFSFNYEESLKTEPWLFTSMIPTWWRHVVLQLLIVYIYDSYLMTSCCSSAVDCCCSAIRLELADTGVRPVCNPSTLLNKFKINKNIFMSHDTRVFDWEKETNLISMILRQTQTYNHIYH